MRAPIAWLQEYVAVAESAEDLAHRLTMGGLEVEGIEDSPMGPVLDVYVTPNRGDCLSMVGVARELSALTGQPLDAPRPPESEPGGRAEELASVEIAAPDLCPRYAARLLENVVVGQSPAWLQQRLESAGQRSINNVVDVTNFVMLELGQPLHAFDLDRLSENRIVVRIAGSGERITTLDGVDRALTPDVLVIADAERPVALAGIMGGADSEVTPATRRILLESAHFDPVSVRRASRSLTLRTEACYRFERVVDPDGVRRALNRACELLEQMGAGEVVDGVIDRYPNPRAPRSLQLRVERGADLLGMPIDPEIARACLTRLGFEVAAGSDSAAILEVRVPSYRPDIVQEEDLVEEVGRIHGYENIPETLPTGTTTAGKDSPEGEFLSSVRAALAGCGLQEVVTHSLGAASFFDSVDDATRRVMVRNALSEEVSGLRRSLMPSLLGVAEHNAARGAQDLALFEVGRVWQLDRGPQEYVAAAGLMCGRAAPEGWERERKREPADFYTLRGVVEQLLDRLMVQGAAITPVAGTSLAAPQLHPGRCALIEIGGEVAGALGELHPRLAGKLSLRDRIFLFEVGCAPLQAHATARARRYRSLSRYPAVHRDLAPRVSIATSYAAVQAAVLQARARHLEEVQLTDVFTGPPLPEGEKSFTLALTFRSDTGTLTEHEVSEALGVVRQALLEECSATFAG